MVGSTGSDHSHQRSFAAAPFIGPMGMAYQERKKFTPGE